MAVPRPREGVCGGAIFFGSALLQPARSVCISSDRFFHCELADNRKQSPESGASEVESDEDAASGGPERTQNSHTVDLQSLALLPKSNEVETIPRMNGTVWPNLGDFQCNAANEGSSHVAETQRFEVDRPQPAFRRKPDRSESCGHAHWRPSSYDERRKTETASLNHFRSDCVNGANNERDCDIETSQAKPRRFQSQENDHYNTDFKPSKVLYKLDKDSETAANCCSLQPSDVERQTHHKPDFPKNYSHTKHGKPMLGCNNGLNDSAAIIENMTDDRPSGEDDGVVFDTSDIEVISAIVKQEKETSTRFAEFSEPMNCSDSLQWDVISVDSPPQTQVIRDNGTEYPALAECMEYVDEIHPVSVPPNGAFLFPSECGETAPISEAVNERPSLPQRSSNGIPTQVFSDISDDDEVGTAAEELRRDHSTNVENGRLLLRPDKVGLDDPSCTVVRLTSAATETENIFNKDNVGIDRASRYRSVTYCSDNCDRLQSSAPRNNKGLSEDAGGERACYNAINCNSFLDVITQGALVVNSNDAATHRANNCRTTPSQVELLTCDTACAFNKNTWDVLLIRQRRRNKLGSKTLLDVVDMLLLKTRGASECSGQDMEQETDAKMLDDQTPKNVDQKVTLTSSSQELSDEPGSPMDEAPPLLAITDLWKDGTHGTESTRTGKRALAAGFGYDSDDTEVAMPVIEDMRPLLPTEDSTANEECRNHEQGKSKLRKALKPLKREISTAGKELLEIKITQSLPVICDRCSFSCGSEQMLHQHIKVCHRRSAGRKERARYVCPQCSATSDDREMFLDHLAHHPGQHLLRYYVCSHCGTDAVDMETMEEHVSSSHAGTVLRFEVVRERVTYLDHLVDCPVCGAAFRWKKNFVAHVRNYHRMEQLAEYLEREYLDQTCPEKLSIRRNDVIRQSSSSDMHDNQNVGAGISGEMEKQPDVGKSANTISPYRYLCETSSAFNSFTSVVVHICCRCTFSTDDVDSYLDHYKGHFSNAGPVRAARPITIAANSADRKPRSDQRSPEQPIRKIGGTYACHLCPFKTPKRMFYHRHMAIHERNRGMTDGYRCGYCQFAHPRVHCITFHLGRYHENMPSKIVRISGGIESENVDEAADDVDEYAVPSSPTGRPSTNTRSGNRQQVSSYESVENSSFSSSATTPKCGRESVNERLRELNDFERRLPPSMFYQEPVKCPLCTFTITVRISMIRHLRTHRNDAAEEDENSTGAEDSRSVVAESWKNETLDAGRYTRRSNGADVVNDSVIQHLNGDGSVNILSYHIDFKTINICGSNWSFSFFRETLFQSAVYACLRNVSIIIFAT